MKFSTATILVLAATAANAYQPMQPQQQSRRAVFETIGAAVVATASTATVLAPQAAVASGGATAGKYT